MSIGVPSALGQISARRQGVSVFEMIQETGENDVVPEGAIAVEFTFPSLSWTGRKGLPRHFWTFFILTSACLMTLCLNIISDTNWFLISIGVVAALLSILAFQTPLHEQWFLHYLIAGLSIVLSNVMMFTLVGVLWVDMPTRAKVVMALWSCLTLLSWILMLIRSAAFEWLAIWMTYSFCFVYLLVR